MNQRTIEFTCYFTSLPKYEEITELFDVVISQLSPSPIDLHFLDDLFKEKKKKYTPNLLRDLLKEGSFNDVLSIIVSSKIRGEDNRIPRTSCSLSRISFGDPEIYSFSIRADDSEDTYPADMIETWARLIGKFGWTSGFGCSREKMNLDFDYGNMQLMHVDNPNNHYRAVSENIQKFRADQNHFLDVAKGDALRSVFPTNYVCQKLLETIKSIYSAASISFPGKLIELDNDKFLWVIEDLDIRRSAFELLHRANLIFDVSWVDLENYIPQNTAFVISTNS